MTYTDQECLPKNAGNMEGRDNDVAYDDMMTQEER